MRDRFTRVLKGHIAIARAVFPPGTTGAQIDALARMALWRAGLDFDHGTGHGVGSYLSVHEGPQRLAKTGTTALAPGMIVSNEPGYYAAGAFGIRIENLVAVETRTIAGGERADAGLRDADARADRSRAGRAEIAGRGRDRVARRLPRARAQGLVAPRRRLDSPLACARPTRQAAAAWFGRALSREPNRRFAASVTGVYRLTQRAFRIAELSRAISPWHRLRLLHDRRRAFQPRELGVDVLDLKLEDRGAIGGGLGASRAE